MEQFTLIAPSLGEGLRNVRLSGYLKKPGEAIRRDEPVVLVETDKATMEIESPVAGFMSEWLHATGAEVAVGDPLAVIRKEIGSITTAVNNTTPSLTKKELSEKQLRLVQAMRSSQSAVIAATVRKSIDATVIKDIRKKYRDGGTLPPSTTELMGWAIVKAATQHPAFRSALVDDAHYITHSTVNLGIAVSLPNDDLATATIINADEKYLPHFCSQFKASIEAVNDGTTNTNLSSHILLSDLTSLGIEDATPVLVSPSIAVIALGKTHDKFNLGMTFDHRLINGAGAAKFLKEIERQLTELNR